MKQGSKWDGQSFGNTVIFLHKHVSIALRLRFFGTVLTPTVLFGLHVLPLTLSQIHALDALQRRMRRSVVGWVRVANEDWHSTMSRKHRLTAALHIHWSGQLARRQYNFTFQLLRIPNWAAAVVKWCPESNWQEHFALQLHRRPGRPTPEFAAYDFPAVNTWTDLVQAAVGTTALGPAPCISAGSGFAPLPLDRVLEPGVSAATSRLPMRP